MSVNGSGATGRFRQFAVGVWVWPALSPRWTTATGCATSAVAAQPAAAAPQARRPPPSRGQIANQKERQRIMDLLKISAIPPGAVSSSPATYNEAEANPYPNLPDPLTLKNGQKVTTAAMWRNRRRRPEILEDFQREIYGRTPKIVPKVTWEVVKTETGTSRRCRDRRPSSCSDASTTPRIRL